MTDQGHSRDTISQRTQKENWLLFRSMVVQMFNGISLITPRVDLCTPKLFGSFNQAKLTVFNKVWTEQRPGCPSDCARCVMMCICLSVQSVSNVVAHNYVVWSNERNNPCNSHGHWHSRPGSSQRCDLCCSRRQVSKYHRLDPGNLV